MPCDVVDHQCTSRASVIAPGHRPAGGAKRRRWSPGLERWTTRLIRAPCAQPMRAKGRIRPRRMGREAEAQAVARRAAWQCVLSQQRAQSRCLWRGRALSRYRRGRDEPSPGADVAGASRVVCRCGRAEGCMTSGPHRNRSCPAVSHMSNLILLPPTSTTRVPNSTPIVCGESERTAKGPTNTMMNAKRYDGWAERRVHFFSVNWCSRHDLPTPMSPVPRDTARPPRL